MKTLLSFFAISMMISFSYAQHSYNVVNSEDVRKMFRPVTSDNNGNVIITGQFETTLTLGNITLTSSSPYTGGYNTGFVAKKLPDDSYAWAKMITPLYVSGGLSLANIYGVNADAAGNVYLTGSFIGKISFANNITLTSSKSGPDYTYDIYTAKISAEGVVQWARSAGTANDGCNAGESGQSVTTDNAGNVYTTGNIVCKVFKNTTVCNEINTPGCMSATSKSITCPYVVKYSAAGVKIWERKFVNSGALASTSCWYNHPGGDNISTDGTYIYVSGYFYGTVDFGTGPLSTGSESTGNTFLLKLNSSGSAIWAKLVTGASNNPFGVGNDLLVDGNDIYISGIGNNISFGECSLSSGGPPAYLARYTSTGICQWVINPLGICYGMVKHPNGNLASLVRRGGNNPMRFDVKEFSPIDGSAVDSTVTTFDDPITVSVWGYPSFAKLPGGYIFSQHLQGTMHFGNLTITSDGSYDNMILVRYIAPQARKGGSVSGVLSSNIILYPNPASELLTIRDNENSMLGDVIIYDALGQVLLRKSVNASKAVIDVGNLSAGVFYVRCRQSAAMRFIKN